jgi:arabinose-5-phosphate isomerase
LETRHEDALDQPMVKVMSSQPTTIGEGARMSEAVELLAEKNLSELPVINAQARPVGMIDITDLLSDLPQGSDLNRS